MAREPWERRLAEQRMKATLKRGTAPAPASVALRERGKSAERTAAAVGLKASTYERGAKVLREAPPELADKLRQGEMTVNRAYLKREAWLRVLHAHRRSWRAGYERRPLEPRAAAPGAVRELSEPEHHARAALTAR